MNIEPVDEVSKQIIDKIQHELDLKSTVITKINADQETLDDITIRYASRVPELKSHIKENKAVARHQEEKIQALYKEYHEHVKSLKIAK